MKIIFLAAVLTLCCVFTASAASLDELTPYLAGQYFNWREYDNNGGRLLRESGPLVAVGVVVGGSTSFDVTMRGRAELFGGNVDYNGQTQGANPVPVRTDVVYVGGRHEFDLGYRVLNGNWKLNPFGGVGFRWWARDLQDSTTSAGQPVSGYTESWQTVYGRLGAGGSYRFPSSGLTLSAEGGAKYPLYTGNSVDFAGYGTTTFHPGGSWSGFAETGVAYHHIKLALSYDGLRFNRSPLKLVGGRYFFQPDSSSDIFGLSLGWAFR